MPTSGVALVEADAFLRWWLDREDRYEPIEGVPVEMMTGASNRHAQIVINIIADLPSQLRGSGCRPPPTSPRKPASVRSTGPT